MIPTIRRVLDAFFWDPAKGPRWFALALVFLGKVLDKGGQIPGTNAVLPLGPLLHVSALGSLMIVAGVALATACGTPVATGAVMAQEAKDAAKK